MIFAFIGLWLGSLILDFFQNMLSFGEPRKSLLDEGFWSDVAFAFLVVVVTLAATYRLAV